MHSRTAAGAPLSTIVRRAFPAFALLVLLSGLPAELVAQDRLVVLDRGRSTAMVVDPASYQVLARLPTGPVPYDVAVSPDGRFAYVSHHFGLPAPEREGSRGFEAEGSRGSEADGSRGPDAEDPQGPEKEGPRGSVTVLDLNELRVAATFQPRAYRQLNGIHVNRTGERLWVTAAADSAILEMDAREGSLLMLWRTAGARSHALTTSPDGRKLYVANTGSDSVAVIDRRTIVSHRIPTGRSPEGLDLSPDGSALWVANREDHTITVIDAFREWAIAVLPSGGEEPVRLRFHPDGDEVWVAHHGSHSVAVFDATSGVKVDEIALPGAPLTIVFSPDGRRAFVGMPAWGEVAVVDASTREVVEWIPAGTPAGMAWSRAPRPSDLGAR